MKVLNESAQSLKKQAYGKINVRLIINGILWKDIKKKRIVIAKSWVIHVTEHVGIQYQILNG